MISSRGKISPLPVGCRPLAAANNAKRKDMSTADSTQTPAVAGVKNRSTTYHHYSPGNVYGGVELIRLNGRNRFGNAIWECKCHCGMVFQTLASALKYGGTKSCGCLKLKAVSQLAKNVLTKHGMCGTRTYDAWCGMIKRCTNPKHNRWHRYGGRGITVDPEWLQFVNFHREMGDCPDWGTLERKNTDGNYCKSNCKWATQKEQQNNRCNNRLLTHNGATLTLKQWAEKLGFQPLTIHQRIKRGWTVSDALTRPVRLPPSPKNALSSGFPA